MPKRASRIETETRLLDAVGALLAEGGFAAIRVNALCRRAGVNKSLLYRYFEDLDGLLQAYAERGDFWPSFEEVVPDLDALRLLPPAPRMAAFFRGYLAALKARPRTLEILAWEGIERNELTAHLEAQREAWGHEAAAKLMRPEDVGGADVEALAAVVSAALHYLLIRSRKIRVFNGLDLRDASGWARVHAALEAMLAGALAADGVAQRMGDRRTSG